MEIITTLQDFVKIKDIEYIENASCEIKNYLSKNDIIEGILLIKGKIKRRKKEELIQLSEELPFKLILYSTGVEINDLDCARFDYTVVEGSGLEISYDILVIYNEERNKTKTTEKEEQNEDINTSNELEDENTPLLDNIDMNSSLEKEKNEITKKYDDLLGSKIGETENELNKDPYKRSWWNTLKEEKKNCHIVFYKEEKELNDISIENNVSIKELLKSTKSINKEGCPKRVIFYE